MIKGFEIKNDETYVPKKGPVPYSGEDMIDYNRGASIRFEDPRSMANALFTTDVNLSAPLHEVLCKAGIPYTLQGTLVTIHPLKGQEVDANIIKLASKVKGVVCADQLVCK